MSLVGKAAVVTGGSRGIGRAIAVGLAARGASVAVGYVNSVGPARAVVAEIVSQGGIACAVRADLSRLSEIERFFEEAEQRFGQLDIVVANAADSLAKSFVQSTEADYDRIFDLNTKGVFFTLQQAAKRVRDGGRIIAISTTGTKLFIPDLPLYLGSKGAVEQFVRALSSELGNRNVTVNTISPGFTDTDLLPDHHRAIGAGLSPFNRVGTPQEVAEVAVFLASDGARWVTGQNIAAGGGVV